MVYHNSFVPFAWWTARILRCALFCTCLFSPIEMQFCYNLFRDLIITARISGKLLDVRASSSSGLTELIITVHVLLRGTTVNRTKYC